MSIITFQNQPINLKTNAFDFIRLLLALLVVISHTPTLGLFGMEPNLSLTDFRFFYEGLITLGGFAVYSFFAISGFLITNSWFNSNNDWALFVKKRIVRIVPAFWTALIVIVFIFLPLGHLLQNGNLITYFQNYFVKSLGFVTKNLFFDINLWGIEGLFSTKGDGGNTINGPIWTVRYELYAYFWLVILGLLGFLKDSKKLISVFLSLWVTYTLIVFVPNFKGLIGNIFNDIWWIPLCTYFFAGSLFFIFREKINWNLKYFLAALAILTLGIVTNLFPLVGPVFFSFIILYLGLRLPVTNLTQRFGDFSYGIYIYSWPIQKLLTIAEINKYGIFVYGALSLVLSVGAGYISWNLVEKKFLKHKL
jgi:peptidoglycan/LPS O-acetylase OafA/YrhL